MTARTNAERQKDFRVRARLGLVSTGSLGDDWGAVIRSVIDGMDAAQAQVVSPSAVALVALSRVNAGRVLDPRVEYLAVQQLKQQCRSVLRGWYAGVGPGGSAQEDLFAGVLQPRYAVHRAGEEVYVPRMDMTLVERRAVASRLRQEGESKVRHADALNAETVRLEASGFFLSGRAAS